MRMTYINVRQIEDGQVFEACHALDLNHVFMTDAEQLDYLRTTVNDLNTQVENLVYQHWNAKGRALKSDEPAQQEGAPEALH